MSTDGVVLLCGETATASGSMYFAESLEQVLRDIDMGGEYQVQREGAETFCVVLAGELATEEGPLDVRSLLDLRGDPRWLSWWGLCQADAAYYRRMRDPI